MYIAAGAYTLDRYIEKYPEYKDIYLSIVDTNLDSFGILLSESKRKNKAFNKDKYYKNITKNRDDIVKPPFDKRFNVLDSGGYQLSIGYLNRKYFDDYIEIYHRYLVEHVDKYTEAFTLDLPIAANLFSSFQDAYETNKRSYVLASKLPDYVRDKILLVSHFRTLNNFELYTKLLYEDGLLYKFKRFSIGGLVIGDKLSIPINLYTIGMLQVLLGLKDLDEYKQTPIRFHILGVSNTKHVLFLYMLKYYLEDYYNLTINLSYDSASLFKGFQRARELEMVLPNGMISKISLKYKNLDKIIPEIGKTVEEIFKESLNEMLNENGYDIDVSKYDIYECPDCPFTENIRLLAAIAPIYQVKKLDKILQDKAKYLIDLYKVNHDKFIHELDKELTMLNYRGKTKYQQQMRDVYYTSLEFISKINTVDDLHKTMQSYSIAMDKETYVKAPTWESVF